MNLIAAPDALKAELAREIAAVPNCPNDGACLCRLISHIPNHAAKRIARKSNLLPIGIERLPALAAY